MVQANNKKLENMEKFLESLGCKIESFLTGSEPGSEVTKAKHKKADLVRDYLIITRTLILKSLGQLHFGQ